MHRIFGEINSSDLWSKVEDNLRNCAFRSHVSCLIQLYSHNHRYFFWTIIFYSASLFWTRFWNSIIELTASQSKNKSKKITRIKQIRISISFARLNFSRSLSKMFLASSLITFKLSYNIHRMKLDNKKIPVPNFFNCLIWKSSIPEGWRMTR